jgi:hypothetical protein
LSFSGSFLGPQAKSGIVFRYIHIAEYYRFCGVSRYAATFSREMTVERKFAGHRSGHSIQRIHSMMDSLLYSLKIYIRCHAAELMNICCFISSIQGARARPAPDQLSVS